mgnify:CR=1 FL=1
MDKKIALKAPTANERKLIIEHYTNGNDRFSEINIDDLVKVTGGFTGADLKTAINEALIEAIHNEVKVSDTLLSRKFDEIRFSSIEQSTDEASDRVIYHELGHAIVHYKEFNEFTQISVENMGQSDGAIVMPAGVTQERKTKTFEEVKKGFNVAVAGLIAEEVFLGDGSLGCVQDISSMKGQFFYLVRSGCYGFDLLKHSPTPWGVNDEPNEKYLVLQNDVFEKAKENAREIIENNKELIEFIKPTLKKYLRISPREFENLVKEYEDSCNSCPMGSFSNDLYETIKKDIQKREYCSISFLQRSYSIGFPKAGRIFAKLQDEGIVDMTPESAAKGCRVLNHISNID